VTEQSAVALEGCAVWRPRFAGLPVEIVAADNRPRAFPTRVTDTLGLCVKAGPAHGLRADGRRLIYPADSLCIRPPGCVWTSDIAPVSFLAIDVASDWLPAAAQWGPMAFRSRRDLPDLAAVARRIRVAGSRLEAEEALANLVAAAVALAPSSAPLLRDEGSVARGVHHAREFLAAHACENLTLAEVARQAAMNKFVLVRRFRRQFGTTPHAFLMAARLERARWLLAGGLSASDVGAATGFADQAHFSRWFKRHYGTTPAAYARGGAAPARSIPYKTPRRSCS
jgi:AraC-like DNA-binding protein